MHLLTLPPTLLLSLALCFTTTITVATTHTSSPQLSPRNEEFQPRLTRDFPHLLGYERVQSWKDERVDPCDDFYEHACGGFRERYKDMTNTDVLNLMEQSSSLLMETILQQPRDLLAKTATDKELFDKTRAYYDSCRDTATIQNRGFSPILPYAADLLAYTETSKSLPELFGHLHQNGVSALFKTSYTKVQDNSPTDLRLQFYPAPAYQASRHTVKKVLEEFVRHDVLRLPTHANLNQIVDWVVAIETEVGKFQDTLNAEQTKGQGLQPDQFISMQELNQRTHQDWTLYTAALNMTLVGPSANVYFWGDADVWIDTVNALKHYKHQDLRYFLLWRLGASHFNKLSEKYYKIWADEIQPVAHSVSDDPSDQTDIFQQDCVTEVGVQLGYLSGHVFVKYAFNVTQKHAATTLVQELITAFSHKLSQLPWMDEATQRAARQKLDNQIEIVGYPEWLADAHTVAAYHAPIRLSPTHYFENAVQAQAFTHFAPSIHQAQNTAKGFQRDQIYFGYPWQLNAFHITDYVQIQINPGILQRPLFSARNPLALNYGSLGMVIGHEITHGFDSSGYQLDKDGVKRAWWTDHSLKNFEKGGQCFKRQYAQHHITLADGSRHRVDGELTLGENVADNGGLDVAYDAWVAAELKVHSSHSTSNNPTSILDTPEPGFQTLTKHQLFYLAFAQTWCTAPKDPKHELELLKNDEHAPNRVRVNAALHNNPVFAKSFKCERGSRMNPERERCFLY
ncbi:hypothetical protein DFJ77DRAFT_126773 [Powellomyces hirtus]|nr:hypothetical protein DFJ77DRAFT_126773 [Powellomyces hirtus]